MNSHRVSLLVFVLAALTIFLAHAAPEVSPTANQTAAERLKYDIAATKFNQALEIEKLQVERQKAWVTGISYMVPLMVAALSFALGVRNQAEQSRLQRESQEKATLAQFELKAAEIVLTEKGPEGLLNRARALKALFPHRLPDDFVDKFNPSDYEGRSKGEGGVDAKLKFFEVASKSPGKEKELAELWSALFPGDSWTSRIESSAPNRDI